jgi:hypothetical protein
MSDSNVPAAPNYAPMIDAFKEISAAAAKHGDEALAWAKEQWASNKGIVDQINKGLIDTQTAFAEYGKKAIEKGQAAADEASGYLKDVRDRYLDPNRQAADMGAAQANVGQAFDAARDRHVRELESYGVNPQDARHALPGYDTQRAATQASAGTLAARQDEARADQADAALLGQGNTQTQQGINLTAQGNASGTGAVSNTLANTQSGYTGMGTGLQWTQPNLAGVTGASGSQAQGYKDAATSAELEQKSSSGLGSLLGAGLGAMGKGGALASGGALAGLGSSLGSMAMFLEDGGVVPPVTQQGNPQGAIPMEASPSGGAVTDDVPATGPTGGIRLNGGEFIIPRDAVSWLGEKTLQDLIMKARKGKEGAQAKPTVGPAPPAQAPQGAIPMGA